MPQYTPIPLATKSDEGRSKAASAERLLNWYVSTGSQGQPILLPRPGAKAWSSGFGSSPVRGMHVMNEYIFVVAGTSLYTVNAAKVVTNIGSIPGQDMVRMTDNRTHVMIAANGSLYVANEAGLVIDHGIVANGVAYTDGYGIISVRQTEDWYITNSDDLTVVGGLDFTQADREADYVTGVVVKDGLVFIVGEWTTEVYQNTGNAAFPFERIQVISQGCVSPGSIAKHKTEFYFIGQDNRVYEMQGYNPVPISTERVERFIESTSGVEAAEAFVFTQAGHTWYVVNFATGTWAYDITTKLWSEWSTTGKTRWIGQHHVYFNKKNIVGDFETGSLYELDLSTYEDNSTTIRREGVLPPIEANGTPLFIDEMLVNVQSGIGLVSGQGSDPKLMLAWSDDDGNTWNELEPQGMGVIGAYGKEIRFQRCGMVRRRRHYRLAITDPVFPAITGVSIRAGGGNL